MKERIKDLLLKMISIKGFFFITMLTMNMMNRIDGEYVFYAGMLFVGGREFNKWLQMKQGKNNE